jgi:hypothetical protein
MGETVTINLKLGDRRDVNPATDPMSRTWVGWSAELSSQEIYEQNRGIWFLGRRSRSQRLATLSHHGEVVAVVALEAIEDVPDLGAEKTKQAIVGRVLGAGDADYDALIGQPVDNFRNPVTYSSSGTGMCACGCGGSVTGNRVFLPGHDQRAIHDRITQKWGTTLNFIEWFDHTYGNLRDVTSDET